MNDRTDRTDRAVAVVGVSALLPEAPSADAFWKNLAAKRYSITDVPPERWNPDEYYDPDPSVPDKTYSRIGGWVRGFTFDWKRFHIPPKVASAMDEGQQWAVTIAAEALADYGYPKRPLDTERTAVVLGTAMGGELHFLTAFRVFFPEFRKALDGVEDFRALPAEVRSAILSKWHERVSAALPPITEDSMPGELPNIISGRVANVLNLRGPNFITDAACASTLAAVDAAVDLLAEGHADAVLTGGVDRNMGPSTFVKFCKIGALSATGTRPFGDGADGFVMGEGCAAFLLKRLADAERDGDRVYAVIRGVGGSSDGKGKGITAPNPAGQRLAVERAWKNAGLDPATATLVEAHGTSTKVGDVVEVESLAAIFGGAPKGSIALGSAKSNVGHLKAGAGAAGLLKAIQAIHHRQLPPTLNAGKPNPNIDFASTPFFPNHDLGEWKTRNGASRRAGVSAYGFGGTNFHVVLEEHLPGALTSRKAASVAVPATPKPATVYAPATSAPKTPPRGVATVSGGSPAALAANLDALLTRVEGGFAPAPAAPDASFLSAPERLTVDFETREELLEKLGKAKKAMAAGTAKALQALASQGIFRGSGPAPGKIAFLFPGQGSQYVNMGRELAAREPAAAAVFAEADRVMTPILGRPLTSYLFVDARDDEAVKAAEEALKQTAITQPAMLTTDVALYEVLRTYGLEPDLVMGHSLGEYAALVAAGVMPFADALEAAAARGREMTHVSLADNGQMAAIMAPVEEVESVLRAVDGYVVAANINSRAQCVIGGASGAVEAAVSALQERGFHAIRLPVSHAFHTEIVAPAGVPLRRVLDRLRVSPPGRKLVANVTGRLYPENVDGIKEVLQQQIASPVQWVRGLETLWAEGARTFVEVGPKRALKGFVDDVLDGRAGLVSLFTNAPKPGDTTALNHALCGLWAAGYGRPSAAAVSVAPVSTERGPLDRNEVPRGSIVVSGTGLGLPGAEKSVMDPENAERILRGEQFVDFLPERFRRRMVDKKVTRVVKGEDGSGRFETISHTAEVIKLAGRPGSFDLTAEYGVPAKLVEALDLTAQLAMAAGLDALREAGIPLVQTWKKTSTGRFLPDRWLLPESLRDETGVVFASAFPGYDRFADEMTRYWEDEALRRERASLEDLRRATSDPAAHAEIDRKVARLGDEIARKAYAFDRRFLFRVLSMGHSQFAEYVGARGPNTQVNSACASTAQAIGLAEDWIRSGRCRRVLVLGADAVTSDRMVEWIGAGFLASGAAATDDKVEEAALPFDRRRHGTLIGMGACALVLESQDAVEERGMRGLVELLSTETRNSAFHGTRLDVDHISGVVESLVASAERRFGLDRHAMARETVFMSHETFTPARGGSAAAEVFALRSVFGPSADEIVVANTKGFTGHPMGVGIEDVIAVKILEHGIVPPVPNFREPDPDLGALRLSRGGRYPVAYAIHLAAGFGSQISLTLTRRIPGALDRVDHPRLYGRWLAETTGTDAPELEVVKRNLRVVSKGVPARPAAPSRWVWGTGPVRRAAAPPVVTATAGGILAPAPAAPASETRRAAPPARPFFESERAEGVVSAAPPKAGPAPAPASRPFEEKVLVTVAPAPLAVDGVVTRVLAIVAEKTGYPPEMLDLDLDLEADLGVDTVKQAETFAAVRAEWDIPRQDSMKLRDFPTLNHVVRFVYDNRPDMAPAPPAPPGETNGAAPAARPFFESEKAESPAAAAPGAASPAPATASLSFKEKVLVVTEPAPPASDHVVTKVLAIVADKTGYPPEMLELDLDLEADLGVDTVKQAETFAAVRAEWDIPRQDSMKLRDFPTLRHVVRFVYDNRPELAPAPSIRASVEAEKPGSVATAPPATGPAPPPRPLPIEENVPGDVPVAPAADEVVTKVLAIVAEKTGYPPEMLELDLDLEADLGVDTVKQAETFAAVRAEWDIPRQDSMKLRDFPTLRHVVSFVYGQRPDLAPAPSVRSSVEGDEPKGIAPASLAARPAPPPRPLPIEEKVREPASARKRAAASLADADRVPRRVAVPSLRPPIGLMKPTGVTLSTGNRVVVATDGGGAAKALGDLLAGKGVVVLPLDPALPAPELEATLKTWAAEAPIAGVFWLPALDAGPSLLDLDLATFRESNRVRVKSLFRSLRALGGAVGGPGTFLVSATRMGGLHGQGPTGATAPLGGAVAGFTKAYKRERPEALVKTVDFESGASPAAVAEALLEETLLDPGVVESGRKDGLRFTVSLGERPAADGTAGLSLSEKTVFVVTGAAGGITSAIVADLAAASGGVFWLLDLVAAPAKGDPKIALFRSDRDGLKRLLIEEAKARGEKPTPVAIDRALLGVERSEAALRAIEAVETAGGTALWRSVNLLDGPAVAAAVDEIRSRHGRIDVLVHAGGVEISRKLEDKEPPEFDLVFDIKADGFFGLLRAAKEMPLGATVVFSSVAGRFGNSGQTDYSAANALLSSMSSWLHAARPATRAIAIDWTAWGGIGMATRGSIPKIMEMAGIDMLPPEAGIPTVRREITAGAFSGEIVVAGRLGLLGAEWDADGGLDADRMAEALAALEKPLVMVGRVTGAPLYGGLTAETPLDPAVQPFLFDHAMNDTPLLPGVMGTEAFAEIACALCPGFRVAAVEDEQFLLPFKFFRRQPATLLLSAQAAPDASGDLLVETELRSRVQPKPDLPPVDRLHFRARVRMTKTPAGAPPEGAKPPSGKEPLPIGTEAIYRVFFHGPAYRVLEGVAPNGETAWGLMAAPLPPNAVPENAASLMAPRLIELCFQTAGIQEAAAKGHLALPSALDVVRVFGREEKGTASRLWAVVRARDGGTSFDADVVDERGRVLVELRGYRTIPLEGKVTLS